MKPLVSILITCFNHEKYIKDCLESILDLNYPRIELLIIDDASTDGSYEVMERYRKRLEERTERFLIKRNSKNLGIGKNRNILCELANGDYYKFVDSDDFLMPDGIDYLVDYFEKNSECSVVHGNAMLVNEEGKMILEIGINKRNIPSGYNLTNQLLCENFIMAPCAMISKIAREKHGKFMEINMGEDWEYWLRVSVDGRIDYIDKTISAYRVLQSSASHFEEREGRRISEALEVQNSIFEIYKEYATKESINKYYNLAIRNAYLSKNSKMVRIVKNKMKESEIELSVKTIIWIAAYKMRIRKLYVKIRDMLKIRFMRF